MSKQFAIGYVCSKGHFQFDGDPDGDSCESKRVATIYVHPDSSEMAESDLMEVISESLANHHRKMEEWRNLVWGPADTE